MTEIQFVDRCTVELVESGGGEDGILKAMLVSTLSDTDRDTSGDEGRINFLMANRHGSPFEHNMMTFRVHAPLVVFREWHRHRIGWSYNEQSGRYTEFDPVFYIPPPHRPLVQVGKPGAYEFVPGSENQWKLATDSIKKACVYTWNEYQWQLGQGIAKEVARGVLPVYTMTSMYATANARSIMAFLSLRRKKNLTVDPMFPSFPMFEIDDCAEQLEIQFREQFPITAEAFDRHGRVTP